MDDNQLNIVITAENEASAVLAQTQQQVESLGTATKTSFATANQAIEQQEGVLVMIKNEWRDMGASATEALQNIAKQNLETLVSEEELLGLRKESALELESYNARLRESIAADQMKTMTIGEMTVALGGNAVASEEAGAGFEFMEMMGNKAIMMLERLAIRMVVIAAVMKAFQFLSDAVKEATASNLGYTQQMEEATQKSDAYKRAIGDALEPAVLKLKTALSDAEEKFTNNKQAMQVIHDGALILADTIQRLGITVVDLGTILIDVVKLPFALFNDAFTEAGNLGAGLARVLDDLVKGRAQDAWKDFANTMTLTKSSTVDDLASMKNAALDWANTAGNIDTTGNTGPGLVQGPVDPNAKQHQKAFESAQAKAIADAQRTAEALAKANDTAKDSFTKLKDDAANDLVQLKDVHEKNITTVNTKIIGLMGTYSEASAAGAKSLDDLAKANTASLATIDQSISNTQQRIADLATKFANDTASNVNTLADAFVKTKEEASKLKDELDNWKTPDAIGKTQLSIAKLQNQLSHTTNTADQQYIQKQIDQQQQSLTYEIGADATKKAGVQASYNTDQNTLAANGDLALKYAKEIADAQAQFDAGSLQKAVDTFKQKSILLQQQYTEQNAALQQQLTNEQLKRTVEIANYNAKVAETKQATALKLSKINEEILAAKKQKEDETTLYDEKVKQINDLVSKAEIERAKAEAVTHGQIIAHVQEEINMYAALAASIAKANSAQFSNMVTATVSPKTKLAEGGLVTSPTVALVGEAGPEMVIPLSKMGNMGGGNIVVNNYITGVVDQTMIEKLGDMLVKTVQFNTAVAG